MEPINWHSFFFLLFALVACAASRWPWCCRATSCGWRSIWCLSLGATAGLFFLAGADFVGAMQLMIYVGGTLVLLIFGVMLTAQGPFISMKTARRRMGAGGIVGGLCSLGAGRRRAFERRPNGDAGPAMRRPSDAAKVDRQRDLGMGLLGRARRQAGRRRQRCARAAWRAICCRSKSFRCICWSC